jgi:hypothetical protein
VPRFHIRLSPERNFIADMADSQSSILGGGTRWAGKFDFCDYNGDGGGPPMPQPTPFSYWIIFGPIAAVGTFSLLLLGLGRTGQRPPDAAWKGSFYSNPNDPALLVPKRFGIGYTLNFGNRWSWAVLVFVLLMVAVPFIVLMASTGHLPAASR